MHSMAGHAVKATIIDVIVALFITVFILLSVYLLFGARIDETISLINKVSIDLENKGNCIIWKQNSKLSRIWN